MKRVLINKIVVTAEVEGTIGAFSLSVNTEIDRAQCLDLVVAAIKEVPQEIEVVLPIKVHMGNIARPVDIWSTVTVLENNNIKIKKESDNVDTVERASCQDQEIAFNALEAMLEEASEKIVKVGGVSYINRIMNTPDDEVYDEMLESLDSIKKGLIARAKITGVASMFIKNKGGLIEASTIGKTQEELESAVNKALDTGDSDTVWAKIKALACLVFRKTVAALKGIAEFAFDTTTLLGACIGRVAYHTARELIFTGKAIGQAFNKDVIQSVKKA